MSEQDVVITGLGLLTPLGRDVEQNWEGVRAMKSGIVHDPKNNLPGFLQYTGKVQDYVIPPDIAPKLMGQMKFLNRGAIFGFCAAAEAISKSSASIESTEPGRRALFIASGDHTKIGYDFMYPAIMDSTGPDRDSVDYARLNESALNKVNPFFLLESLNNNLFSFLSAYKEFMGPSTSLGSLSPCGGNALELAYRSIKQNRADIALAVGYGSWINEIALYELDGLGILSRCKQGSSSFKPFDRGRDGFIPGEGGAAILLESYERAKRGSGTVLGRIGEVENCIEHSPNHAFSVPRQVAARNITSVLKAASLKLSDLALVIPHGSGTQKGDRSELNSLMEVFSSQQADAPVCAMKPYTGHMGAASDLAEIIFGIYALKEQTVPATLNFHKSETQFSHINISAAQQKCEGNYFLSVSYGVGGQSSSVIVEVY